MVIGHLQDYDRREAGVEWVIGFSGIRNLTLCEHVRAIEMVIESDHL